MISIIFSGKYRGWHILRHLQNTYFVLTITVQLYSLLIVPLFLCFFSGKVDEQEWRFLLTGGVALENKFLNPASGWLTDKSWAEMVRCSALPAFKGILQHFTEHVSFGRFVLL